MSNKKPKVSQEDTCNICYTSKSVANCPRNCSFNMCITCAIKLREKKCPQCNWDLETTIDVTNGQHAITYPDNSTYIGDVKNGQAHGNGVYKKYDGSYVTEYHGRFSNGRLQGLVLGKRTTI